MKCFYADSSVLVKRHVMEIGSTWVENLCNTEQNYIIITSQLSIIEVISALNRRLREGSLDASVYPQVRDDFLALCHHKYQLVLVTNLVLMRSRTLLEDHALRAYDALHLASALLIRDELDAPSLLPLTFLAADNRLLVAAMNEGLTVDNPNKHT